MTRISFANRFARRFIIATSALGLLSGISFIGSASAVIS